MKRWMTLPFLMLLALLAGSELIVRVGFQRNMEGRFEYGYSPTAGFAENADGTVSLTRTGGRRFWPQTFSKARPADTFRVMVIGDSVPRGSSLETSYASQIGEKLRASGIKAESFNLAVGGNGALRSQIILRQALNYEPSLVILHVNNSNEFEDEREYSRAQAFKSWHPKNWLMKSLVIRRLYEMVTEQVYWAWVPAEVRNLAAVSDADDERLAGQNAAKLREWDERVRKYTAESMALARAAGAKVLLVTQAHLQRDPGGKPFLDDEGLDEMIQPMLGDGVYQLSMKQVLQETDFAPLFVDSAHVNPAGHALLAEAVMAKLREAGVVAATK